MPIGVHCESCGKSYKVKDELAGKKVRCPCGATVTVPPAAAKQQPAPAAENSPFMNLLNEELKRPHEAPQRSGGPFLPVAPAPSGGHRPGLGEPPTPRGKGGKCKLAQEALIYAILAWVCCGLLAFPARSKANDALDEIARNPGMTGEGQARAAKILSTIVIVLICINILLSIAGFAANLAMNR